MMPIGPAPVISTSSPTRSIGECGVDGIAEGIEDGADLVVDLVGQMDGIEGRESCTIFGEGARHVDADALGFGIEMEVPGPRHAALHADEMALARHPVADLHGAHMAADVGRPRRRYS